MNTPVSLSDERANGSFRTLLGRFANLVELSDTEIGILQGLPLREKNFSRGENVFYEGEEQQSVYVCLSGWGARYRLLPDGQRQIVDFILPGGFFGALNDASGLHMNAAESLLDLQVAVLDSEVLRVLARKAPRLSCALALCLAEESARLSERIVSLGRRDAKERLAHFFLELQHRLSDSGESADTLVRIPIPQQEVADFLGLTSVHVSRTMRSMMDEGLIAYDDEFVNIVDEQALSEVCDFEPDKLHASPIPEDVRNALLDME